MKIPVTHAQLYLAAQSLYESLDLDVFGEAKFNHMSRMTLDPFVFDVLHKLYMPHLDAFWETHELPKTSDKAIVFVERRPHQNLEFCIKNACYFARDYALYIFCSKANLEFIRVILGDQFPNVRVYVIWDTVGTPEQGKIDYNELLKNRKFWESIDAEHILTMENDAYLLRDIPDSMYDYDYVASKWTWLPDEPGGGGLSYRKRSAMLRICDECPHLAETPMQDSFVSEGVKELGLKYPNKKESEAYFVESEYSEHPVGVHQWWTFVSQLEGEKCLLPCLLYTNLQMF